MPACLACNADDLHRSIVRWPLCHCCKPLTVAQHAGLLSPSCAAAPQHTPAAPLSTPPVPRLAQPHPTGPKNDQDAAAGSCRPLQQGQHGHCSLVHVHAARRSRTSHNPQQALAAIYMLRQLSIQSGLLPLCAAAGSGSGASQPLLLPLLLSWGSSRHQLPCLSSAALLLP